MRYLIAAMVVVTGCSAPIPAVGDACDVSMCDPSNGDAMLYCFDGVLQRYDCAGGCRESVAGIVCDARGSRAGDSCPPSQGFLSTCGDTGVMICFSGIWQELHSCEPNSSALYSLCDTSMPDGTGARCVQINSDGTAQR